MRTHKSDRTQELVQFLILLVVRISPAHGPQGAPKPSAVPSFPSVVARWLFSAIAQKQPPVLLAYCGGRESRWFLRLRSGECNDTEFSWRAGLLGILAALHDRVVRQAGQLFSNPLHLASRPAFLCVERSLQGILCYAVTAFGATTWRTTSFGSFARAIPIAHRRAAPERGEKSVQWRNPFNGEYFSNRTPQHARR